MRVCVQRHSAMSQSSNCRTRLPLPRQAELWRRLQHWPILGLRIRQVRSWYRDTAAHVQVRWAFGTNSDGPCDVPNLAAETQNVAGSVGFSHTVLIRNDVSPVACELICDSKMCAGKPWMATNSLLWCLCHEDDGRRMTCHMGQYHK